MSEVTPPPNSGSGSVAPVATLPLSDETPVAAVPALGSVIADQYRVEELIARGGMGAVYLATHLVSGKRVALKWMLPALGQVPGAKERFEREASATARIEHPNVIDIYDVGNDRGSVYLVMELLRGETLAEYLQRSPQVSPDEAVSLLMPALRGVAAAHAHHVIHRDLKPENIFLCRSAEGEPREPRVLDFGISKITSVDAKQSHALTRSGAVMGTPYYMSPEQVRGSKDVDERCDVYAFGVILYEMLTGQRPFEAETYNQLILKIATEDPAPILERKPGLDTRLAAVVERAMAREPAARHVNIEELALALEPFAGGMLFRASTVRFPSAAYSGEREPLFEVARGPLLGRARSFMALGIVLGCLIAAAGLWALSRSRSGAAGRGLVEPAAARASELPGSEQETRRNASLSSGSASSATRDSEPSRAGALEPPAPQPDREARVPSAKRPAAEERKRRAAARAIEPIGAAPVPRPEPRKLATDWDDQLSIPSRPARNSENPAGPIDARDLRE